MWTRLTGGDLFPQYGNFFQGLYRKNLGTNFDITKNMLEGLYIFN